MSFFLQENRRRIEVKLAKIKSFTPFQTEQAEKSVRAVDLHDTPFTSSLQADRYLVQLDKTRDLSRSFCHIDMDAFYAAVEVS